jgi:glycerate kinase
MFPTTVLIVGNAFGRAGSDARGAEAVARGLRSGARESSCCPLDAADLDRRMWAARAVVTGGPLLDRHQLAGSAIADVATRARQGGVPCYAIVAHDELDAFDKRILDIEAVLESTTAAQLERAGRELAAML